MSSKTLVIFLEGIYKLIWLSMWLTSSFLSGLSTMLLHDLFCQDFHKDFCFCSVVDLHILDWTHFSYKTSSFSSSNILFASTNF